MATRRRSRAERTILSIHIEPGMLASLAVLLRIEASVVISLSDAAVRAATSSPDVILIDADRAGVNTGAFVSTALRLVPKCQIVLQTKQDPYSLADLAKSGRVWLLSPTTDTHPLVVLTRDILAAQRHAMKALPANRYVWLVIDVASRSYAGAVRVDSLARLAGVSSHHLTRLFRQQTGFSIRQYLRRIRVEVAKQLLVTTTKTLSVIAQQVGFSDSAHLSRAFAQETRSRPGRYRASIAGRLRAG
jgi:AraC-like DNA-binding protein